MEQYAQYSVSDWTFESGEIKYTLDYINKEQITYTADGGATVSLWFQIQSDSLKEFLNVSKNKIVTLTRERYVRIVSGEDYNLKEKFGNISLLSLVEDNEINEVAQVTLNVQRSF
jgi:hypothetical protein